jgi:hypothetical protein
MFIPGFIISILTFPGVMAHEFGHKVFCLLTGTKVYETCYFRFGNPAGYVKHAAPDSVWRHILIGLGPLFVNTSIGFAIGWMISRHTLKNDQAALLWLALAWLGISIAMHSFPSTGDAKSIWRAVWNKPAPLLAKFVGTPVVVIVYLGALGSIFWLDLVYGAAVVFGLPFWLK